MVRITALHHTQAFVRYVQASSRRAVSRSVPFFELKRWVVNMQFLEHDLAHFHSSRNLQASLRRTLS
jgi:hypothetical protein